MKDRALEKIEQLRLLSLDAFIVFEQAGKMLGNGRVKTKLAQYNLEHEEHLQVFEKLIQEKTGKSPSREKSPDGIADEALALLKASADDTQILKVLREVERVLRENYLEALRELGGDEELAAILNHNLSQETKHFAFAREALAHPEFFREDPSEQEIWPGSA